MRLWHRWALVPAGRRAGAPMGVARTNPDPELNALKKCLEENFLKLRMQKHVAGLRQKEARGLTILS